MRAHPFSDRVCSVIFTGQVFRCSGFVKRNPILLSHPEHPVLQAGVDLVATRQCLAPCRGTDGLAVRFL
jgi:hypothetical protein